MAQLVSQRDQPGTQREYETIYILKPDAPTEQIQEINDRIRGVIEGRKGKLLRLENWGKRKLAYEISKQLKGIYLYWRYLSPADVVAEVERNLRMLDQVIRFISVKVDEDVDPNARPTDVNDESYAAAAATVPDEEDTYLGRGYDEQGEEESEEGSDEGEEGEKGGDDETATDASGSSETSAKTEDE